MLKRTLILVLMLICISAASTAYAGTINSYEQDVMSAAQGTYQYNGTYYKIAPAYISQLRDYLMADDVNLTASQRDSVLSAISGYIESGVQGGYLVPVDGQTNQDDSNTGGTGGTGTTDNSGNPDTSGSAGNTGDAEDPGSTVGTDTSGNTSSGESQNGSGHGTASTGDNGSGAGSASDITPSVSPTPDSNTTGNTTSGSQDTKDETGSTLEDILDIILGGTDSSSPNESGTSVTSREDEAKVIDPDIVADIEAGEDSIIKNTGFDLSPTFAIIIIMGGIMLAAIYITVRYQLFTRSDEDE